MLGKVLGTALLIAIIFAADIFVDFPHWTYLPEIWTCPGDSAGFQFCVPF